MKRYFFLGMLFLLLVSCNRSAISTTQNSEEQNKLFLKKEFKLAVFQRCLKYGFNDSQEIEMVLKNDISLQMDFPLGVIGYKLADSLAQEVQFGIKQDSISIYKKHFSKNPDFKDLHGSRVLLFCLDYYTSAELDSLATEIYDIQ